MILTENIGFIQINSIQGHLFQRVYCFIPLLQMAGPIPTDVAAEEAPPVSFPYRAAHLPGIPLFGYLMGTAPQTAHFRIFSVATTRVLLFLQHELHVLELQLLEAERRCSNSSDRSNFDFQHIKRSRLDTASQQGDRVPSPGDSASSARWETTKYEIMLEMKDKLKEYRELVLFHISYLTVSLRLTKFI